MRRSAQTRRARAVRTPAARPPVRRRPGRCATAAAALLFGVGAALGPAPASAATAGAPGPGGPATGPAPAGPGGLAGTVALSNCSGALIRLPRSRPADPALVLTNGHCLQDAVPEPGEVRTDEPSGRGFTLLDAEGDPLGTLRAARLTYATVTGTDVAVYRLTSSYAEIGDRFGSVPRTLDARRPAVGTAIEIPSGYWKHVYHCAIDGFVPVLREGRWAMTDSLRYTRACATVGGTSGAPVVDSATGRVVGVNSTGNDEGGLCLVHNPCEVAPGGRVTARRGVNYGQQTYGLVPCFSDGNVLALTRPGCRLPGR
ncbi:serine protease [Streptomyces chumphonensis]|uniref:Trypsin-like peptidase domain-containing protein n=1 Tax=Streptomyces chumphonensis TaxID=1214925 RepID=A0A927IC18_9ACTN|nr:serine protease [Streptomyces chumphonensis]MBD3933538.1 trypsin-like peptidase domain-containing protein [Streptomyces chumphonensis]